MAPQNPTHQIRKDLTEPIVRYVQEPAARPLVYAFKQTPVTPNQITALSALFAIGAAYLFSLGEARALIQGGIILEISLILDSVENWPKPRAWPLSGSVSSTESATACPAFRYSSDS